MQNAQRDPEQFRALYRHYFPRIYAYVAARVGRKHDAEDVVSEIFVKVVEALNRFEYRGEGSFTAWLFRIAHNHVVQFYRRQGRSAQAISLDDVPQLRSDLPSPDEAYLQKERFARLLEMLDTLSPRRQEIISLRFFGELRNQEIAEVLGLSEKTVASHLSRGLDDLHHKYDSEMRDDIQSNPLHANRQQKESHL